MAFTFDSTCDEVVADIDLTGKTAVVTGAYGGLGKETVRALASKGAAVIAVGRDPQRITAVVDELKTVTANPQITPVVMDLADLRSVEDAAKDILKAYPEIHILINNAGIMACPLGRTAQGFEMQIGVNHIGHCLMTSILLPALKAAAPSRIVTLTSVAHKWGNVVFDDINWQHTDYNPMQSYSSAKTANALFAVELNRRYAAAGVTANAVHPGLILTELGRHFSADDSAKMQSDDMVLKTIEQGAATSVWAATSPELEGKGGLYLEDCHIGVQQGPEVRLEGYCDYALDAEGAKQLWQLTEELISTANY